LEQYKAALKKILTLEQFERTMAFFESFRVTKCIEDTLAPLTNTLLLKFVLIMQALDLGRSISINSNDVEIIIPFDGFSSFEGPKELLGLRLMVKGRAEVICKINTHDIVFVTNLASVNHENNIIFDTGKPVKLHFTIHPEPIYERGVLIRGHCNMSFTSGNRLHFRFLRNIPSNELSMEPYHTESILYRLSQNDQVRPYILAFHDLIVRELNSSDIALITYCRERKRDIPLEAAAERAARKEAAAAAIRAAAAKLETERAKYKDIKDKQDINKTRAEIQRISEGRKELRPEKDISLLYFEELNKAKKTILERILENNKKVDIDKFIRLGGTDDEISNKQKEKRQAVEDAAAEAAAEAAAKAAEAATTEAAAEKERIAKLSDDQIKIDIDNLQIEIDKDGWEVEDFKKQKQRLEAELESRGKNKYLKYKAKYLKLKALLK